MGQFEIHFGEKIVGLADMCIWILEENCGLEVYAWDMDELR